MFRGGSIVVRWWFDGGSGDSTGSGRSSFSRTRTRRVFICAPSISSCNDRVNNVLCDCSMSCITC